MKGGVGKSTDAILLANNLAARGFKVLFFDMDTNNSSTIYYTLGMADEFPTQFLQKRAAFCPTRRNFLENARRFACPDVISVKTRNVLLVPT